jgi:anaerobic selenocysteine-containing dehydrogenase
LFINPLTVERFTTAGSPIEDGDWLWVESAWGKVKCICRFSNAVEPSTVWTWNAIGKASGAWGLSADANEANKGFLLNHLTTEELPLDANASPAEDRTDNTPRVSNADPVTGQAAWYDLRVKIYPAEKHQIEQNWPHLSPMPEVPGQTSTRRRGWLNYFKGSPRES